MIQPLYHALERLEGLSVADVMSRHVATVPEDADMGQAAAILSNVRASGAPVVDAKGRCVGVISLTDFLRLHHQQYSLLTRDSSGAEDFTPEEEAGRAIIGGAVGGCFVRNHMTAAVQTIESRAPLLRAARTMCAEHIHRLIVLNDEAQPIGIVTTLDVAAALIKVVDEEHRSKTP